MEIKHLASSWPTPDRRQCQVPPHRLRLVRSDYARTRHIKGSAWRLVPFGCGPFVLSPAREPHTAQGMLLHNPNDVLALLK